VNGELKIYCEKEHWGSAISIHAAMLDSAGNLTEAEPLTFSRKLENGDKSNPFITLPMRQAQVLIDALWDCGLRPSEGSGSAGALAAVKYHLEDMRKLVFKE
jgi:hypothetical protein